MDLSNLKVGDKVFDNNDRIGVVKRITPTGRIVVEFGTANKYEERFGKDGWQLGSDSIYYKTFIRPLTKEKEEELVGKALIKKCIKYFDNNHQLLTPGKAQKIMEILNQEEI